MLKFQLSMLFLYQILLDKGNIPLKITIKWLDYIIEAFLIYQYFNISFLWSDEKALVSLNRAKNQHGNVMIKYGITSDSGFKEQKWEKFEEGQERLDIEVEFPQRPLETSS